MTVVAGAPPMFADWAELPDSRRKGFAGVRLLLSGAAALAPEVEAELHRQVRPAATAGIRIDRGLTRGGDLGRHR